ncbi:MAG: Gfo/Idh/MocA family oxidoreductase, partial [Anaerolineae bacterium]|nr:Gfo/Idh/MocA family oxidoreductase [Anaerolineae bacterium]
GTMDRQHVPTTLPLLYAGYHVLLEKPISPEQQELLHLLSVARETQRILMICHVLRYAPFYVAIRERVLNGEIGEIVSINCTERVSYHHMAVGFVRGKWRKRAESNPMLLAKCCHDLDLICWMKSGVEPRYVASHGSLMVFRPDNAPPGSGTRCLVDCQIESRCPYSARKNYIEQGLWRFYAWDVLEHIAEPTIEQKLESLRTDNPFGRCVWRCDNDVVDHQSVIVDLTDGCVATHTMVGGASRPCRTIHLVGTRGEIEGTMEEGHFVVRHPDARAGHEYVETRVDIDVSGHMHGGGDFRLVQDFVSALRGEPASISSTCIEDSVYGHLIAYAADRAMRDRQVIEIKDIS